MSAAPRSCPRSRFTVVIKYREPTYALRLGEEREYSATFVVGAEDPDQARARGVARFEQFQALSGVGWTREIVSVEVRDGEDAAC